MMVSTRSFVLLAGCVVAAAVTAQSSVLDPLNVYEAHRDVASHVASYLASPFGLPDCTTVAPFNRDGIGAVRSCMPSNRSEPVFVLTLGNRSFWLRSLWTQRPFRVCAVPPALLAPGPLAPYGGWALDPVVIGVAPDCLPGDRAVFLSTEPETKTGLVCDRYVPNAAGGVPAGWSYEPRLRLLSVCAATGSVP